MWYWKKYGRANIIYTVGAACTYLKWKNISIPSVSYQKFPTEFDSNYKSYNSKNSIHPNINITIWIFHHKKNQLIPNTTTQETHTTHKHPTTHLPKKKPPNHKPVDQNPKKPHKGCDDARNPRRWRTQNASSLSPIKVTCVGAGAARLSPRRRLVQDIPGQVEGGRWSSSASETFVVLVFRWREAPLHWHTLATIGSFDFVDPFPGKKIERVRVKRWWVLFWGVLCG